MGTILIEEKYKQYKNKRYLTLLFLYVYIFFYITLFLILFLQVKLDIQHIVTIYLVLTIILTGIVIFAKTKTEVYAMQINYLSMLLEENMQIKLKNKIYTKSWLLNIEKTYQKKDFDNFIYYYKFVDKTDTIISRGTTLINIIVSKIENIDFYSDNIFSIIENNIKNSLKPKKVRNQITLQFNKYKKFDEDIKQELDKIILYKTISNSITNINIGYFEENNEIYFLHPQKRYPNKYYYYACSIINDIVYKPIDLRNKKNE